MASTKRKTPKLGPMDAGFLTPLITDFGASLAALGHSRLTGNVPSRVEIRSAGVAV
jgi:hypothetical protein